MDTAFRSDERFTQAEFFDWVHDRPAADIYRYELLGGHIVMTPPAGVLHAEIEARIIAAIFNHVDRLRLGTVYGSSAGFELPSGDTIEPDASFISAAKLAANPPTPAGKFSRLVPDLVVEILSKATARRDRTEKKKIYEKNGVAEYWIVSHQPRQVTMFYRDGSSFAGPVHVVRGSVDSRVLAGLRLSVDTIFGPTAR